MESWIHLNESACANEVSASKQASKQAKQASKQASKQSKQASKQAKQASKQASEASKQAKLVWRVSDRPASMAKQAKTVPNFCIFN